MTHEHNGHIDPERMQAYLDGELSPRRERALHDAETARRSGLRHVLLRAVMNIMERDGVDDLAALKTLRGRAMRARVSLEDAAAQMLAETGDRKAGGRS